MESRFPFPIAYMYHLIGAGRDPAARYERMLRCYEMVVQYCATVQLSNYLTAGCPDAEMNVRLIERLSRKLSLGHWIEMSRQITALQKRGVFSPFMPEMVDFYFKPGKGASLTAVAEIFDSTLVAARNEWAHPDQTWSVDTFAQKLKEQKALLDRLLEALSFLTRYTLYVPYRGPRPEVVSDAFVLMGTNEHPQIDTELKLQLSPQVLAHLEYETTAFLVSQEDASRQLPLYPLFVFANRNGAEDVFLFDSCEWRKQALHRLVYRGVRVGQKPLEVLPGSDYERLVTDFKALIASLGSQEFAVSEPPAAEDYTAYYFAAQRRIIEQYTASFVGREEAQRALDDFLSTHRRGYFIVRGGPGQGKTAVAAHLIKTRGLAHHIISRTGGRSDVRLILRSLLAQLIPLARANVKLPDSIAELNKALEDLLSRMASSRQPVVLVIDGLDELPSDSGEGLSFFVTEALPEGAYVVVTSRAGDLLDKLQEQLFTVPRVIYDLGPLKLSEMRQILATYRPAITDVEVERVADASQGNPLYLRAVAEEMASNPGYDLRKLPPSLDSFFRRATASLRDNQNPTLRDVIGLLTVARKPLSLRELGQVMGEKQRTIDKQGIGPIRQFLLPLPEGYCFYHARFQEFVDRELLYEDEHSDYHRKLAEWLQRPESRAYDYRLMCLAYHLFESGDHERLRQLIDQAFLAEKVQRFGYAALEDVELLARSFLEAGDAALVERCAAIVEDLREVVGGDVIGDATKAMRSYRAGVESFRSPVIAPAVPSIKGVDLYVGMLPKVEVAADFFEAVPMGDRLTLAIGDAPSMGIKSAFVARFIGNLFRKLVSRASAPPLNQALGELNSVISAHEFFERVSMQCVEINRRAGVLTIASAGHPYPVLYSARRHKCDRLPVRGELLHDPHREDSAAASYENYFAEISAGDILVLITDGLTEGHRFTGDSYGYRFMRIVEAQAGQSARAIGEMILDDWRVHPRDEDYADDVTVMVAAIN